MIAPLHQKLLNLKNWQRLILAFAAGAAATLAMPPWHYVPLLLISFPLLLWMLEGCKSWQQAAALGWSFGFGHFLVGLNWIANAFYVDAQTFGVFAIPAVGALCAAFGLYISIVTVVVHRVAHEPLGLPYDRTPTAIIRALLFALTWCAVEWVRGWFLTGFPWNPLGSVWAAWPAMTQITSVIGTLGLSLVTVFAVSLVSVLGAAPRMKRAWSFALVPVGMLVAFGAFGWLRLQGADSATVPDVVVRLVQPNIAQADKWRPGLRDQHFMDHVRLSAGPGIENVTHVVWGEAAVAFALDRDEARRQLAVSMLRPGGALMVGVPRAAAGPKGLEEIFNSLLVIDATGTVNAVYDKTHLVPFGEYLPLRWLIPFRKLTEGTMDFSSGPGRTTLTVPGLPAFSPLICYEAIFSGAVTGPDAANGARPLWMLNITNDSWFGDTSGPRQHLAQAQLRAVEEGLPVVRVANTGISAVIDPYGRVLRTLELNQRGVMDSQLPTALERKTVFAVTGQALPIGIIVLGYGLLAWVWRKWKKTAESDI